MSEGLITIASRHGVKETLDRLESLLAEKSIGSFARIDHAAGATSVGMTLRPTELLIFGNPRAGTPLMQAVQEIGIDLPLKMLAYEDEAGTVRLAWTDISWLARRYRLPESTETAIGGIAALLKSLAESAAG